MRRYIVVGAVIVVLAMAREVPHLIRSLADLYLIPSLFGVALVTSTLVNTIVTLALVYFVVREERSSVRADWLFALTGLLLFGVPFLYFTPLVNLIPFIAEDPNALAGLSRVGSYVMILGTWSALRSGRRLRRRRTYAA